MKSPAPYRFSQLLSLLLGARVFVLLFFTLALYVSTFFIFSQEKDLWKLASDYKVHGIIFCALLSIAAGGIINRFYDRDKDKLSKPFRSRLQNFLNEKYFLYSYLALNSLSIIISAALSLRIFLFFLVYQFFIWLYSHKLSKMLILNNLTFVSLSLYPFFGMLVYYKHFSFSLFLMAVFLFLMMLVIDLIKDILTKSVDKIFGYQTIANFFGVKVSYYLITTAILMNVLVSLMIVYAMPRFNYLSWYFVLSIVFFITMVFPLFAFQKNRLYWMIHFFKIWVFVGVVFMLFNGFFEKF